MTAPRATLRLQFHRGFTFDDAAAFVDYFAALGVSHLYASPVTTAEPGSTHGYDTVDYSRVSAECGGEAALVRLAAKLHERGMGLIVDVVPNHMGIGGASNAWWLDILEWGQHSAYARYFDVDWSSPDPALHGKVLMPCLGAQYGDELAAGRIVLRFAAETGHFHVGYGPHVCPVCPLDYATLLRSTGHPGLAALAQRFDELTIGSDVPSRAAAACAALSEFAAAPGGSSAIDAVLAAYAPSEPVTRERLHQLLERQHFRLAWWRAAADEVNWRRFFDIGSLAAVCVERPDVFEAVHALVFRLYAQRIVDGVRIDHVDGLADPREYCLRVRQRLAGLRDGEPYLVVEKILGRGEPLRGDWQVDGTTGYDFMNDVGALLHDPAGAEPLAAIWAGASGSGASFADEALAARRKIVAENLAAELDRATRALHRIARGSTATRDFTFGALRRVLTELVVHFPVYRIYPRDGVRSADDDIHFERARTAAKACLPRADHALLERVDAWLGGRAGADPELGSAVTPHERTDAAAARRIAQTLFSQLSAPLAAKAVEDTACYRYGRLLSRNEVGADPAQFALSVEQFHAANLRRARHFPRAMLATATHDHKRGEDVRARLAVLSEIAHEWGATLRNWSTLNAPHRRSLDGELGSGLGSNWAPGPAVEAMLYQMLVGSWPLDLPPDDEAGVNAFAERIAQWQLKALREAKLRTDWLAPDTAYEAACRDFLFDILAPVRRDGFLGELARLVGRIARPGVIDSLQQTLLRLASPGVPDLYQGTELWDFSLVDPDNRRPVDFARRHAWLADMLPSDFAAGWRDGRVKQAVVRRALALRAHRPGLFCGAEYLPLAIAGAQAGHLIAFARRDGPAWAVVVATRLAAALLDEDSSLPLVAPARWDDTTIALPRGLAGRALFDWLSHTEPKVDERGLLLAKDVLATMPIALLTEDREPPK